MSLVEDIDYKKIEATLLLYNEDIQDITTLIMSFCFFLIPESLRDLLAKNFPKYNIQKEANIQIDADKLDWDDWIKEEVKLRVGVLLCSSVVSDEIIIAMIVLPEMRLYYNNIVMGYSPASFLSDGQFWTYNLKHKKTISNHQMEAHDTPGISKVHNLVWFPHFISPLGKTVRKREELFFFGYAVEIKTQYVRLRLNAPWDKADVYTILDNFWFSGNNLPIVIKIFVFIKMFVFIKNRRLG